MRTADRQHRTNLRCRFSNWRRRGAAAVEFAVISPVLLLTAIGTVDVGQYAAVGQIVNNASREGARVAIRADTASVSQVEAAVLAYMTDALPGVSSETIDSGLSVSVTDTYAMISGDDMTNLESGYQVSIQVTFDYQSVRWAPSGFFGSNTIVQTTTIMRRE